MAQDKKEKKTSKSPKRGKSPNPQPKREKSPGRTKPKATKKGAGGKESSNFEDRPNTTTVITADNIMDVLPPEYQQLGLGSPLGLALGARGANTSAIASGAASSSVDPLLYYLPKQAAGTSANKFPNFRYVKVYTFVVSQRLT